MNSCTVHGGVADGPARVLSPRSSRGRCTGRREAKDDRIT